VQLNIKNWSYLGSLTLPYLTDGKARVLNFVSAMYLLSYLSKNLRFYLKGINMYVFMTSVKLWCSSWLCCILNVFAFSMQTLGKCCTKLVSSKLKLLVIVAFYRVVCTRPYQRDVNGADMMLSFITIILKCWKQQKYLDCSVSF
jgi:hypothetical protein